MMHERLWPAKGYEELKKTVIIIFSFLAALIGAVLGVQAAMSNQMGLFIYDSIMFISNFSIAVWMLKSKANSYHELIFVLNNMLFFIYLFSFGGFSKTGFMWGILVPVCTYFVFGFNKGTFFSAGYLAICVLLVVFNAFFPGFFQFPDINFLARGAIIYVIVSIIAASYELFRIKSQELLKREVELRVHAQEEAEKSKLQIELIASKEKYSLLFNSMKEGFALHEIICDDSGKPVDYRFLDVNKAFEDITGLKRDLLLNRTVLEVMPGTEQYWINKYGEVALEGKSVCFQNFSGELGKYFSVNAFSPENGKFAVIFFDITELKMMERRLMEEKERLRVTLMSVGDGVISTDKNGRVDMINDVAQKLTGWTIEEAAGREFAEVFNIINEHTGEKCENIVEKVIATGKTIGLANHTALISKDGTERSIADSAAPIINENGKAEGVVIVFRDITEVKKREEEIRFLSYNDSLTGLYNRRYFEDQLKRLDDEKAFPVSLIIGDLNGLKLVNDVFGHLEGDALLMAAARIMKKISRPGDILSRWGGDEFVMLLPNTSEKEAERLCKEIKRHCEDAKSYFALKPSVSLGFATKENASESLLEVLKTAEDYMYRNKLLESRSLRSAIVNSIKNTLCEKSHETEEHAERIKQLCKSIGEQMGLSEIKISELELLAVLHDIGKIAIKDSILNKPGKLTEEEWQEMKRHPEIGYRIAQSSFELIHIAEYILSHHEKWDGNGYPRGLKGNEIPLLARIVAIADAYDAMISDRPYRKALDKEAAAYEIRRNAGNQFDPDAARVFVEKVLGQKW